MLRPWSLFQRMRSSTPDRVGRALLPRLFSDAPAPEELNSSCVAEPDSKCKPRVYTWGCLEHGALGLLSSRKDHLRTFRYKQKPTRHYFGEENHVTKIDCGFGFTLFAVKSEDLCKLFGCGLNTDSQIGYHDPRTGHPLGILLAPAPIYLPLQSCSTRITSVSAGRAHSVIVTDIEGVFTLGSNCYGQCGRPVINEEKYCASNYIHQICDLEGERIIDAVCGQDHTIFLTDCGSVYACGWGADGQVGSGNNDNLSTPTRVCGAIQNEFIIKVAGKSDTILALTASGKVYGWGNSEYFQLTHRDDRRQAINSPVLVEKLNFAGKIVDIAAGGSFCMALNEDGEVFVWGYGILGLGPEISWTDAPQRIPSTFFGCNAFQPDISVLSISCGMSHLAAVNNCGSLYTWGRNKYGCLGIGHVKDQYFPYKVCLSACVESVHCGVDHTFALGKPFL